MRNYMYDEQQLPGLGATDTVSFVPWCIDISNTLQPNRGLPGLTRMLAWKSPMAWRVFRPLCAEKKSPRRVARALPSDPGRDISWLA